jgi:SAM-dependent methyltransferase
VFDRGPLARAGRQVTDSHREAHLVDEAPAFEVVTLESHMKAAKTAYRRLRRIGAAARTGLEFRRARRAWCNSADLSAAERDLMRRVSLKMHTSDFMYRPGWAFDYLEAGLSATRCIRTSLGAVGKTNSVGAILDFPCGYGRVLRFLKQIFPDSAITGAEIEIPALEFCRRAFAIETIPSTSDFRSLSIPRKFDLIWCGSLITHLDEHATADLLGFFYRHLLDGGVCIFSTSGDRVVELLENKTVRYEGLSEEMHLQMLRAYRQKGYGFAEEMARPGHGYSLTTRARAIELARGAGSWKHVHFMEKGWHRLQDVFTFMR